jgi:hypothetical protein
MLKPQLKMNNLSNGVVGGRSHILGKLAVKILAKNNKKAKQLKELLSLFIKN